MRRSLLWLLASLGLASIASVTKAAPLKVMAAPNLLRVGTSETVFVECQDCSGQAPMEVRISVWNFPTKRIELIHTTVTLNTDNKFQALADIVIPSGSFDMDPTVKQYVYLLAAFPGYTLEKVVLVSFQKGFLFIQTDKTVYTPDSIVNFRIFALTPGMKPIGRDHPTGSTIWVEIETPEGILIPLNIASNSVKHGMHTGSYKLGKIVSLGTWKVVSRFQSNPQQKYTAEFEVKKYVLPSYEVKLTSDMSFYYYDTDSFRVRVKATYLSGKEVTGTAYVVFGVMAEGGRKVFPASLQRIPIHEGVGEATLQKAHILQTFPEIANLIGRSLFVTATVYTESGSEMAEGELKNLKFVESPYFINFDKTPKYFQPGLLFDVTVTVTYPDGTPAEGVPVIVIGSADEDDFRGTTRVNGRISLTVLTRESDSTLTITARTNDTNWPDNKQTSKSMVAKAHQSNSRNFIQIYVGPAFIELGGHLRVLIALNHQTSREITYLIVSRGQLVSSGRQVVNHQVMITLNIPVNEKMLPSFRLIVYYHPTATEVVSDSIWVDVEDSCMGSLKLEPKNPAPYYQPGSIFSLRVTGEPGATVGLVAVDKSVYVLNQRHRLTQKKVWEIVEKADTGCTPGGGKNSMGVFYDAGLMFSTDTAGGTPYRQEMKCSPPARKRRAASLLDAMTTLASRYTDSLRRECCQDGMKNTLLLYTCAERAQYVTDGKACEDAFRFCCEELGKQLTEVKQDNLILARSEDDSYIDRDEISYRTLFLERLQWMSFVIPPCRGNPDCPENTLDLRIPLKDSITTWVFTGISLSENKGICVGKSLDVVVSRSFFIDLKLPYSAVVGEQIEIKAILHNYIEEDIIVKVDLTENTDVCSSASKKGKYTQQVILEAFKSRAVPFVVIPMKEGKLNIEVFAAVKDLPYGDRIIKSLLVVPRGVLTSAIKVVELNPAKHRGRQEETVSANVPKANMVPNKSPVSRVFVTGREQVSPLVESVIGASSMGRLIYRPTEGGEQNMHGMTETVIATMYLDKTNQWEKVGLGKRSEALTHILTGFQQEMQYAKVDGSFAMWAHEKSSTWLTAYVVKVFSMASHLVTINHEVICNAVQFLILRAKMPDGMFKEIGPIYHREMTGDGRGADSDASMTAFCLIALQESQPICSHLVNNLTAAINTSVSYLENRLPSLTNPYAVAITSYALSNANKLNKELLYYHISPDQTHWESPRGHVFSLEATAYALLALVKREFLEEARPIVRWFTRQQRVGGGYGSTQATIMVYQAVAEYWTLAKEPDYNLDVELMVPNRAAPYHFQFTRENHYSTKTLDKFDIDGNVKVIAKGIGEATLTLLTQYYAVPKETVSDCTKFNLSVELSLNERDIKEGDLYKLKLDFFFKNENEDASMTIIDITIPTGFIPVNEDLNALEKGRAAAISRWEYNKELSERGSIILYMKRVLHDRIENLVFRMRQIFPVGVLQPASVSIYEYYDETKCVKFYHPQRKDGQIQRLCRGDECLCAEENCSMQKKGAIDKWQRIDNICEITPTRKIDFVYHVVLENASYDLSFDVYAMRIKKVIKEGTLDINALGQLRKFLSFSHCRESLNLERNKGYLIMGTEVDTLPDDSTQSIEYLLGERTWIEYWPSSEECQTEEHKSTCLGIKKLVYSYGNYGCPGK